MGTKHLLGIDIGTSSVKVALIDMDGNLVGNAAKTYRLIQDGPGYQQMDAEDMWRAVLGCVREISKKVSLSLVVGIGISCLCPGLTAFDRDGLVLINPILYSDQRSMAEAEQIKEKIGEEELFAITDRIVVLRDGRMAGDVETGRADKDELIRMMVGRELSSYYTRNEHEIKGVSLEVKGLSHEKYFRDVSFQAHYGEVVGFAGLVGARRTELMKTIFGAFRKSGG